MNKNKSKKKSNWMVMARVTRTVHLYCEGCTREQVEDPDTVMGFVTDEQIDETTDWEVLDVEEYE